MSNDMGKSDQPPRDGEVLTSLMADQPKFHDDAHGNPISWNANIRLLRFLDTYLQPGMRTLETGSGYSTVLFIGKQCIHTALTPAESEFERIIAYCKEKEMSLEHAEFIAKNSADHLPFIHGKDLDVLFIDGAHAFPFPIVDWFYGSKLLKKGGIVILDDTDIIGCFILQKFLEQDTHWEQVMPEKEFAVFRKLEGHDYPGDWPDQVFSNNKIDGAKAFFLNIFFKEPAAQEAATSMAAEQVNVWESDLRPTSDGSCKKEHPVQKESSAGDHGVSLAQQVAIDQTSTFDYKKLTEEEIEEYSNIEVTEDLREGGIHAQEAWGYWFQYLAQHVWKTSLGKEIIRFCDGISNPKILSLGCGYGGVELELAQYLKNLNKPYEITAVDINQTIFAKAEKEVRTKGLNIRFLSLDLNFVEIRENSFDLVFAHASLHHLLNLEHVFYQIYKGLKANGRLIIQDIIGKTQVLFWKENVDFAIEVVRKMPAVYKEGIPDQEAIISPYTEPSIQRGMEGIRQEEIELQVSIYFTPVKMFRYGSFIRMICTHPELGKRINPDKKADREYLEYLFRLDLQQIEEEKLRPTEMLAVFEKRELV